MKLYFLAITSWEGPTRNTWTDIQCSDLQNLPSDYDKQRCKQACRQKRGCTAFNYNKMGGCVLRACSPRIPAPAWDHFGYEGYYLTTGKILLGGDQCHNHHLTNSSYIVIEIMIK